jgi:hypothetical protein
MADGNKGPESIADILGKLFTSRGWGRKNDRLVLEAAWAAAAGPDVAAQTTVLGLRRGVGRAPSSAPRPPGRRRRPMPLRGSAGRSSGPSLAT